MNVKVWVYRSLDIHTLGKYLKFNLLPCTCEKEKKTLKKTLKSPNPNLCQLGSRVLKKKSHGISMGSWILSALKFLKSVTQCFRISRGENFFSLKILSKGKVASWVSRKVISSTCPLPRLDFFFWNSPIKEVVALAIPRYLI